ncbi:hypothetical protein CO180_02295 [candidate division WWE3 bacterium CG_4_9_14_3_um_filter_41_6]|uniref:GlcNAc-PI de-N-acetylase n=1 Tax=candidate division WWE3 bacterium CG_4_10_14_0_2_um_filter_41_14 TaxID=1975072 RepID=A0A2M7TKW4_UNCKA|nr:MAG: hypothetical protein COY32_01370 [candidate division WWE3 bacterium CG_4_10_14_0_2_um_filter_41_14]PJA38841.1 MAG: hypothetical protein CO180_02295 [candidate division WWE3 bacterium CG_4_9_14_3_um_filter_41_6]
MEIFPSIGRRCNNGWGWYKTTPPTSTMEQLNTNNKTILGITAHPDDHVCYAGTILKLQKQGYSYVEVVLSDAEESGMIKDGERVVAVEKSEQLNIRWNHEFALARKLLDIKEVHRMKLPNLGIEYSKESVMSLMEIVRRVRPEIALIHHPEDYMSDHIQASYLSLEALKVSSYSFRLDLGKNHRTPRVYYFEGVSPIDADVLVDITEEFSQKIEVLEVYGSQFGDRAHQLIDGTTAYRGYPRRVKHAEAFEIPKNYPQWEIGEMYD